MVIQDPKALNSHGKALNLYQGSQSKPGTVSQIESNHMALIQSLKGLHFDSPNGAGHRLQRASWSVFHA